MSEKVDPFYTEVVYLRQMIKLKDERLKTYQKLILDLKEELMKLEESLKKNA